MNPDQTVPKGEQSDQGPYSLQRRLPNLGSSLIRVYIVCNIGYLRT